MVFVIEDLHLRCGFPDVIMGVLSEIEDARVPSFGDLPFELEMEIRERFFENDVSTFDGAGFSSARTLAMHGAVNNLPAGWEGLLLVSGPTG